MGLVLRGMVWVVGGIWGVAALRAPEVINSAGDAIEQSGNSGLKIGQGVALGLIGMSLYEWSKK